jgi:16S rRNA (guanine527-N7)-methyltransferase
MRESCDAYVREVLRFSGALNLTSIRDATDFQLRFVAPSLALCRWMPDRGRLLDIGSGMGIPGIPILIACAGLHGILVERRKKRAEFLRHIVRLLKLDAEVYDRDVRELDVLHVDVCVARAVSHPSSLLDLCAMHANAGARAVFPVADRCEAVALPNWRLEEERAIDEGVGQKVQIYRYAEVSRET